MSVLKKLDRLRRLNLFMNTHTHTHPTSGPRTGNWGRKVRFWENEHLEIHYNLVSRFSDIFSRFWDLNIKSYWCLKNQPVISWKFPRQIGSSLKKKIKAIAKRKTKMLITSLGLADKTTLYLMQWSSLSEVNDKMSFKAVFVCLNSLFPLSCAVHALIAQAHGIYFLLTSRQYNTVLPSQNRN